MTNLQLYLAVGIPFFTLLLVWLSNTRAMERGFDGIRQQLTAMDKRMDRLDTRMDKLEQTTEMIGRDMREFYGVQRQHDARLSNLEGRQAS